MLVGRRRHFLRRSLPGGVVLEALAGDGRLLFSGRIHFCACLHLVSSTSSRSCWLSFGGCFAAVLLERMLCRCRRWLSSLGADTLPPLLVGRVDALPPCFCCRSSHLWRYSFFCRFSCWLVLGLPRIGLEGWRRSFPSCFCCCGCWVFIYVSSVFSLFLVFCDLVLVKFCLAASRIFCKLLSSE